MAQERYRGLAVVSGHLVTTNTVSNGLHRSPGPLTPSRCFVPSVTCHNRCAPVTRQSCRRTCHKQVISVQKALTIGVSIGPFCWHSRRATLEYFTRSAALACFPRDLQPSSCLGHSSER